MKGWPPKDWRALMALVFSVAGAIVLTAFLWYAYSRILPEGGWTTATEASRAFTARWVLWIVAGSIGAVLLGLGMAINRRSFKGNIGKAGFDFEGGEGEPSTPAEGAQAAAQAAERRAEQLAASESAG